MDGGKMQPPAQSSRKRQNLTLDLTSASAKRNKVQSLLTSPDVQMLKLTSPELEKFLSQNPSLATPTPSGSFVTEEQIMYAKGFEEALEHLKNAEKTTTVTVASEQHTEASVAAANTLVTLGNSAVLNHNSAANSESSSANSKLPTSLDTVAAGHSNNTIATSSRLLPLPLSTANTTNTSLLHVSVDNNRPLRPSSVASAASLDSSDGVKIKDEPDDGQSSMSGGEYSSESLLSPPGKSRSGMSPIDMDDQERIKLERKRMRNRLAASKCRRRKLEKISQLDERVLQLKAENADLAAVVKKMKANVAMLKQEVIEHVNSGCDIRMADINNIS